MYIFGKIMVKRTDGTILMGQILNSDIFENNLEFKASLVIDFEDKKRDDDFLNEKNIDYIVVTFDILHNIFYGIINVERNIPELNDVMFDEDYFNNGVSRFYVYCKEVENIVLLNRDFSHLFEPALIEEEIKKYMKMD